MRTKSCFIMGLPEACKTTYLAALWYSLGFKGRTVLSLKEYTGNHKYLAQLSETWLSAEKVSRTSILSQEKVLPLLLEGHNYQQFEVTFPDLSGEIFQKQYNDREIDKELSEYIRYCDSILLFINPYKVIEPCLISQLDYESRHSSDTPEEDILPRNPLNDDPTEVQLVELLQFINYLKDCMHTRLGIIISAWDIRKEKYDRPEKFVKEELPFLWQYLFTNSTIFDVFYYGVSAQGGPLENEEDSERLASFHDQMERILVVNNNGAESHDITLPLWEALQEKVGETK